MDKGYFLAEVQPDSSPGRPIGDNNGAIMVFDDRELAFETLKKTGIDGLAVFLLNVQVIGRVER